MPSLKAYHLTRFSLTLNVGYLLTDAATNLGCRVSPLGCSSAKLCILAIMMQYKLILIFLTSYFVLGYSQLTML